MHRSRSITVTGQIFSGALILGILFCSAANADNNLAIPCNIPVFRFALERWQPDPYELIVLTKGELTDEDRTAMSALSQYAKQHPKQCRVSEYALGTEIENEEVAKLASQLDPQTQFPYLLVRNKIGRRRIATSWQGRASDFGVDEFFKSPVRTDLANRLLNGHSVVWLVVASSDDQTTSKLTKQLLSTLNVLQDKIPIPEGVGMPGSELYSTIPLSMKFSVVTIERDDPKEKILINLLKQFQPDVFAEDVPLVVPVFGKGRALEVVPGNRVDANLIEDLSIFLSGACSCQVKDLNPGFDLPLAVNWNKEIFGEDIDDLPPESGPGQKRGQRPELVPIAPGNSSNKERGNNNFGFCPAKIGSPLPANSDENRLPLGPTYSEFVGRGAGGEGISRFKLGHQFELILSLQRETKTKFKLAAPHPPTPSPREFGQRWTPLECANVRIHEERGS